MKKNIAIISFLLLSLSIAGQNLQTEGSQYVSGKLSVYPAGTTPDNGYNGNITITKPASTGQYINLIRQGNYPWSIGMVYNTNNFAIGNAVPNDQNFSNPFFVIGNNGNVGIGTPAPQAKFDVGAFIDNEQLGSILGRLTEGNTTGTGTFLGVKGYGTQSYNYNGKGFAIEHNFYGVTNSSINFFRGSGMSGGFISFNTNENSEKMRINANGNVSIGTVDPDPTGALLTVKGKIHAQEVLIDLNSPLADYVFSSEYKLMPLFEVEKFVKLNRHLPEIPSAADVKENGLNMGEMQNKLLQKIEELTLYVIEQQKQIDSLKKDLQLK